MGGEEGKCGMEEEQFPVSFFKREREIKGKGEGAALNSTRTRNNMS